MEGGEKSEETGKERTSKHVGNFRFRLAFGRVDNNERSDKERVLIKKIVVL